MLILLGVWVIVRDKDGRKVARVAVPEGGSVNVETATETSEKPLPQMPKPKPKPKEAANALAAPQPLPPWNLPPGSPPPAIAPFANDAVEEAAQAKVPDGAEATEA